jgi:hypothetical protein
MQNEKIYCNLKVIKRKNRKKEEKKTLKKLSPFEGKKG